MTLRLLSAVILAAPSVLAGLSSASFAQGPPPAPVRVEAVVVETVGERRMVTGEILPLRRARVAAQETGFVLELVVEVGDRVEAGQLLARLDAERLELEHRRTEAELNASRSQVEAERALAERWASEVESLEAAARQGASNARERRDAQAEARQAAARLERAERDLLVYDARLALLERRLRDTRIVAPFTGTVTAKLTETGEWLAAGDAVCELLQTDTLEVVLNAPQRYLGHIASLASVDGAIAPGEIAVELDLLGEPIELSRVRLIPEVSQRARTFQVRALAPNPEGRLAPGLSVIGYIPTGVRARHTIVPVDSVVRNDNGTLVYVARSGEDGASQAVPANVEVLFELPGRAVVASPGLAEGDRVVTEGKERLWPTAPIRPMERAAEEAPRGAGGGEKQSGEAS